MPYIISMIKLVSLEMGHVTGITFRDIMATNGVGWPTPIMFVKL